jgi:hypothetical protein
VIEQLVVLEFEDEAKAYLRVCQEDKIISGSICIIPLSLPAQLILKKNNIPYQNTLAYFDKHAHARAMEQSEEWLTLLESFTGLDELLIGETCFCIRPVINYLLWVSEVIVRAWETLQPEILVGPGGLVPVNETNWKLTPRHRPLGFMLQDLALKKGIKYRCFNNHNRETTGQELTFPAFSPLSPSIFVRVFARVLAGLTRNKQKRGHGPFVCITADGYGMGSAMKQMGDEIFYFSLDTEVKSPPVRRLLKFIYQLFQGGAIRVPVSAFKYNVGEVKQKINELDENLEKLGAKIEGEWRSRFEYKSLDLAPYIVGQLRNGIRYHLGEMLRLGAGVRSLLNKIRPDIVISPFSSGIYSTIGEECEKMSIPTMLITHGSHLAPRNRLEEIEQRRLTGNLMLAAHYRYTAAQSPWAVQHAVYFGAQERALTTVPVLFARTAPSWGELLRSDLGIPGDACVVVYAVAQRKRSSVRFLVYETEDEYLQDMIDLVNAVNQMENVYLVLKLHPSSEFSDADMRSFLPDSDRLLVLHREPFDRVLSASDVLVSYGSTTIEEAVLNRIPVIQYDRWGHYCHLDAFDCNKGEPGDWEVDAVYYVSDAGRLAGVLKHAFEHAGEAAANDKLYEKHVFRSDQVHSLFYYIKGLRRPGTFL